MNDLRTKTRWLLAITQGRWQVMEGETMNLTGVGFVEVVPAIELARYQAALEDIHEVLGLKGRAANWTEHRARSEAWNIARSMLEEKTT